MGLEIKQLEIPDNSPEARAIERVVLVHHLSPEDAIRQILRDHEVENNPALRMIGLFSSDEDSALMDEVLELAAESRRTHTSRNIGI